jgi:hypothetical protein
MNGNNSATWQEGTSLPFLIGKLPSFRGVVGLVGGTGRDPIVWILLMGRHVLSQG